MTVAATVVVLQVPYGNPGSLGEPLGIFTGRASVTGDASSGHVEISFVPQNPTTTPTLDDQREEYVWFLDAAGIIVGVTGGGNCNARLQTHFARSNTLLPNPLDMVVVRDLLESAGIFAPTDDLIPESWKRVPIFWDTQELAVPTITLLQLGVENNVDLANYTFSVYGRYYDRQILSNRGFGRLISPVAISQFEG